MTAIEDLVREIDRLKVADDEVLVVRPRRMLMRDENERLMQNLRRVATALGWDSTRIVVLAPDIDLTVVKADQMSLSP